MKTQRTVYSNHSNLIAQFCNEPIESSYSNKVRICLYTVSNLITLQQRLASKSKHRSSKERAYKYSANATPISVDKSVKSQRNVKSSLGLNDTCEKLSKNLMLNTHCTGPKRPNSKYYFSPNFVLENLLVRNRKFDSSASYSQLLNHSGNYKLKESLEKSPVKKKSVAKLYKETHKHLKSSHYNFKG